MELVFRVEELKKNITVNLRKGSGASFFTGVAKQDGQILITSCDEKRISGKVKQVVKLNDDVFSKKRKVNDQLRFVFDSDRNISDIAQEVSEEESFKVLIILESPHRDEYNFLHPHYSSRPANGMTGDKIKEHYNAVLSSIYGTSILGEIRNKIEIIVMNRICYQTSLGSYYPGKLIKQIRNNIFKEIWNEETIQKDFEERLLKYQVNLVINACTIEVDKNTNIDFSEQVFNILENEDRDCLLYESSHPASWSEHRGFMLRRISPPDQLEDNE